MSNVPDIDKGSRLKQMGIELLRTLVACVIAIFFVLLIVLMTSETPLKALDVLFNAILAKKRTIGLWLDDVAKLTVSGLAFSLVFQARQFALGVQSQIYVGALAATYVVFSPLGTTYAAIPLGITAAMLAGAVCGFLPGLAKAKLGANEIVSTLMLNYIAIELCNYLVRAHLPKPVMGVLTTNDFPDIAVFPALIHRTRLDIGFFFAIFAVFAVWFALYRTSWGLKLRLVGHNEKFAECAGIPSSFIMVSAMTAAGALGGLLGAMFVQGQSYGKLTVLFEGNFAFEGILVAIVARNRPLLVPLAALAYAYLRQGAQLMNIRTDVPAEIIGVLTAIIILVVSSNFKFPWLKQVKNIIFGHKADVKPHEMSGNKG